VDVQALEPANCGFDVGWSAHFSGRHAGAPLKTVAIEWDDAGDGADPPVRRRQKGEFVVTATGVEGSLVYAASAALRQTLAREGQATFHLDLLSGRDAAFVAAEVARPRGTRSLATHLKSRLGIDGVKMGLLHECLPRETLADPAALARAIKALPLTVRRCRPLDEAISTAGGVRFEALAPPAPQAPGMPQAPLMLRARPGVFCAGEMLDWEAPTGGYLLTACFATGRAAGAGAAAWWRAQAGAVVRPSPASLSGLS
jgi:uncharacterized flavoprotein (TIGR03862 family)